MSTLLALSIANKCKLAFGGMGGAVNLSNLGLNVKLSLCHFIAVHSKGTLKRIRKEPSQIRY